MFKLKNFILLSAIVSYPLHVDAMEDNTSEKNWYEDRWIIKKEKEHCVLQDIHENFQMYTSNASFRRKMGHYDSKREEWNRHDTDYVFSKQEHELKISSIRIIFYDKIDPWIELNFVDNGNSSYVKHTTTCTVNNCKGEKDSLDYTLIFYNNPRYKISRFFQAFEKYGLLGLIRSSYDHEKCSLDRSTSDFLSALRADNIIDEEAVCLILDCYRERTPDLCNKIANIYFTLEKISNDINKIAEENNSERKVKTLISNEFKNIKKYATPDHDQTLRWKLAELLMETEGSFDREIIIDLLKGITDSNLSFFTSAKGALAHLLTLGNTPEMTIDKKYKPKLTTLIEGIVGSIQTVNPLILSELTVCGTVFLNNDQISKNHVLTVPDFSNPSEAMFMFMNMVREQNLTIQKQNLKIQEQNREIQELKRIS